MLLLLLLQAGEAAQPGVSHSSGQPRVHPEHHTAQ
jgi:predicted component of type VI protein secretion system